MPDPGLQRALTEVATQTPRIDAQQLLNLNAARDGAKHRLFSVSEQIRLSVIDALEGMARHAPGRSLINKGAVAENAIIRVRLGHPLEKVIADIETLFFAQSFYWEHIRAIQGVKLLNKLEFSKSVCLDVPKNLVPSRSREMLFQIDELGHPIWQFGRAGMPGPSAALVVRYECPATEAFSDQLETNDNKSKRFENAHLALERVLVSLALSGKCSPESVGQTTSFYLPGYLPSFMGGGIGGEQASTLLFDEPFNAEVAKKLYGLLAKMQEADWVSLNLAGKHIIQARNAKGLVNRAVELRVAAEIILMHKSGDPNTMGEITYKIAQNGAALLGKTPQERFDLFGSFRDGYGATSAAIHQGRLDEDKTPKIDKFELLVVRATTAIIERGKFPSSWNKLVYGLE